MSVDFKPGDVVALDLPTGSPPMTVAHCSGDRVYCVWFSTDDKYQERTFFTSQLNLLERKRPCSTSRAP